MRGIRIRLEAILLLNIDDPTQRLLFHGLHVRPTQTLGLVVQHLLPLLPIDYNLLRLDSFDSTGWGTKH